jgi:hypothetical protein
MVRGCGTVQTGEMTLLDEDRTGWSGSSWMDEPDADLPCSGDSHTVFRVSQLLALFMIQQSSPRLLLQARTLKDPSYIILLLLVSSTKLQCGG